MDLECTRYNGTVVKLMHDKGYGFIKRQDDGSDVFFHCSGLRDRLWFDETLRERRVTFRLKQRDRGLMAVDIEPA